MWSFLFAGISKAIFIGGLLTPETVANATSSIRPALDPKSSPAPVKALPVDGMAPSAVVDARSETMIMLEVPSDKLPRLFSWSQKTPVAILELTSHSVRSTEEASLAVKGSANALLAKT